MGISFRVGNRQDETNDGELAAFAETVGMVVSGTPDSPRLRGTIDGSKVNIWLSRLGRCRIEVDFDSGLERFRVYERSSRVKTNFVPGPPTGDSHFDAHYSVMISKKADPQPVLTYLTAERREVIDALGDTFEDVKIEDDEFRVHMSEHPPLEQLHQAIGVVLLAAEALRA